MTGQVTGNMQIDVANSCEQAYQALTDSGIFRGWLMTQQGRLQASDPRLESLAGQIAALPDFDDHEAILVEANPESRALYVAFVHSTVRGQAQGGVRLLDHQHYGEFGNLITDGLRLARGMTEKNAVARLWWGGGKGIICPVRETVDELHHGATDPYPPRRERLFENYGRFIASIRGVYVTAEDMNTGPRDMRTIHSECRFVTCVPEEIGGSANPSTATARGVFVALQAGMQHLFPDEPHPLQNQRVLFQGVGNVGRPLLNMLVAEGARLLVFEPNPEACSSLRQEFGSESIEIWGDTSPAGFRDFVLQPAEIFSPNAVGSIVDEAVAKAIQVKLIAGAANNQLEDSRLAKVLHQRGILYLPDFLINCMGIVNCANEQYGYTPSKISTEVANVRDRVINCLAQTDDHHSVHDIAMQEYLQLAQTPHPIWPGNGQELLKSLRESDWAGCGDSS